MTTELAAAPQLPGPLELSGPDREAARAVASGLRDAKADNPTLHPVVAEAIKGWRNRAPAPRQTGALTSDALARIREVLRLPRRGRGGRTGSTGTAPASAWPVEWWRRERPTPRCNARAGGSTGIWSPYTRGKAAGEALKWMS